MRPLSPAVLAAAAVLLAAPLAAQSQQSIKVEKDRPAAAGASHGASHGAEHANHMATSKGEHTSGWAELDAYHTVMMAVWHPAKDKNDLAPLRARTAALAAAADVLAAAPAPASCAGAERRALVAGVAADSRSLATFAPAGPDAEVKRRLSALHDRFETLNRGCKVPAAAAHKH